ncbi:M23 family metallopeptidase [Tenacibaculum sp. 190524A05c]|uniref:Murein DD-endopeptidase n=1 Tax=Tenacibaculum platacis TaxID=3137852 RepID=A0ABP1EVL8_9FLAO
MAKVKYYYDPETLSYQQIEVRKRDKFKNTVIGLIGVVLVAVLGFVVLSQFFESPSEKATNRELENSNLHIELLGKRIEELTSVVEGLEQRDNYIYRTYFEANPIPDEQRKSGFGGINRYKNLEGFNNSGMITDLTKDLDVLSKRVVVQSKSLDEIVDLAKKKEKMLASIPAIKPIKNEDETRMASGFGMRLHPILKSWRMHNGMDFTAPTGTPIYASGNGQITRANRSATFGKVVYIEHGYGYKTVYAHMSKIVAKKGQKVKRGDLIGYVGNTGRSAAPHLHYEVHKNGRPINPIYYYYGDLSPEEFIAMQKASQELRQSFD